MKFGIQYSAATRQVKNCQAANFKEFYDNVLQAESVAEEKSGRTFTPAIFRHPERLIEHAMELSMIVLDVDQKPHDDVISLEEMTDALIDMNFEHCIYTSHSNTAECPRFRVVMPLGKLRTSCSSVGNGRLRDAEKPAFQSLIIG